MDEALEQMTKLANELCDQLEKVEAENKSLKEQLAQVKTASEAPAAPQVVLPRFLVTEALVALQEVPLPPRAPVAPRSAAALPREVLPRLLREALPLQFLLREAPAAPPEAPLPAPVAPR